MLGKSHPSLHCQSIGQARLDHRLHFFDALSDRSGNQLCSSSPVIDIFQLLLEVSPCGARIKQVVSPQVVQANSSTCMFLHHGVFCQVFLQVLLLVLRVSCVCVWFCASSFSLQTFNCFTNADSIMHRVQALDDASIVAQVFMLQNLVLGTESVQYPMINLVSVCVCVCEVPQVVSIVEYVECLVCHLLLTTRCYSAGYSLACLLHTTYYLLLLPATGFYKITMTECTKRKHENTFKQKKCFAIDAKPPP